MYTVSGRTIKKKMTTLYNNETLFYEISNEISQRNQNATLENIYLTQKTAAKETQKNRNDTSNTENKK